MSKKHHTYRFTFNNVEEEQNLLNLTKELDVSISDVIRLAIRNLTNLYAKEKVKINNVSTK